MEQTFSLDQKEQQQLNGLEQDNLRLNARYGVLCREMKDIEQRIASSEEQQRGFMRNALANRGVEQVDAAQIVQGQLVARVPDEKIPPSLPEESKRVNGAPAVIEAN